MEDEESATECEEEAALDRLSFSSVAIAVVDGLSGVTVKFSAKVQTRHVTIQHASMLQKDGAEFWESYLHLSEIFPPIRSSTNSIRFSSYSF